MSHAIISVKSLKAEIGGHVFEDVIQYTSSWAMNSIPMASITVAVGRNVRTGEAAAIHAAASDMTTQMPATVYLEVEIKSVDKTEPGLPDKTSIKIFEGKVVGTGWHRSNNAAQFVINLLHWIGELNYSSAISASLHPGSPADFSYSAIFPVIGSGTDTPRTGEPPSWVPSISQQLSQPDVLEDLWGNLFLPWMERIARDDPVDLGLGKGGPASTAVLAALSKMEAPNPDGVPLQVDKTGSDAQILAEGVATALLSETGGNWTNTTMWGKLIGEWAPAYWFSVVPRVEDALIVPFTGGLRGDPWAVIGNEDYTYSNMNSQLQQVLRAVGIAYPAVSATGYDLGIKNPLASRGGLLGMYCPDPDKAGMHLLKDVPKWLTDPVVVRLLGHDASGINGVPVSTTVDPVGVGADADADIDHAYDLLHGIASRYAEQWYVLEALKGRVGEVVGKLRFDIAPGSNVRVAAGNERHGVQVKEAIYATVMQVSYVINAESRKAATAFNIAHIRSEEENKQAGSSIEKPPLYTTAWKGAKLVPAAPGPET